MEKEEIIRNTAIRTLRIEADALDLLSEQIQEDFISAVKLISSNPGRLVISGIGKTAIVAQKIVSTLNSTGTASIFLHAADAVHGDLGMIQKNDIVLCISKSGETEEMKLLVSLVKNFGNTVIAMVSKADSFLSKKADLIIHVPVPEEADPNNLAPTTSTTLQIAMGDAMATSLLALRGFSSNDFAQLHPGGSLGKQLYARVSDICAHNPRPFVLESASIRETIIEISSKRLGACVVLDSQEKLIGIITDGDLRRMLESEREVGQLVAKDIMSPNPKTIEKDELAAQAYAKMKTNSISQLVVLHEGRYFSIVHVQDLLREGIL